MGSRKRDYRAEYKRRIARGKTRGLSVSQARGHAKTKTVVFKDKKGKVRKKKVRVELRPADIKRANARARRRGIRPVLRPGATRQDLKRAVARDALYVFGELPRRQVGDAMTGDGGEAQYQLRLQMLESRMGAFDWVNERNFISQMMALGLTEREAYSNWFSPGGVNA